MKHLQVNSNDTDADLKRAHHHDSSGTAAAVDTTFHTT
jgi:hypothetical protein